MISSHYDPVMSYSTVDHEAEAAKIGANLNREACELCVAGVCQVQRMCPPDLMYSEPP